MDGVVSTGRLAVYTTIYPAVAPFLERWHASLRAQTDRDFDLWVGLDGLEPEGVTALLGEPLAAQWILAKPGETPAALRARAIDRLAEESDAVLFVDSDDELFPDRVAAAREALAQHEVAACALKIIDEGGADTGLVFEPWEDVDWVEFLPRYNVFGLSNSAYRTETLRRLPPAPPASAAIDWSLATRALSTGASLYFDRTPQMAYRQYGANIARVVLPFSSADVVRATSVVRAHYGAILGDSVALPAEVRTRLEHARRRVEQFSASVCLRPHRLEQYVAALNSLEPRYVWWWCVANPELETLWTN